MSQLFSVPGDSLENPLEINHFNDIARAIEKSCTDLINKPDWESNLEVCDLVNATLNMRILNEVTFLLRRKLGSIATPLNPVSPTQVMLTLSLIEALVKNGGRKLHAAINDEKFMKEMGNVARRYCAKPGKENNEVAELALEIIQAWGEGFLTRRRQYFNIVDTYHQLRKERLPFKAQYDSSRVPIFTPASEEGQSGGGGDNTDAILRSMAPSHDGGGGSSSSGEAKKGGGGEGTGFSGEANTGDPVIDAVDTSGAILADMILATGNTTEVLNNEIVDDMAQQLRTSAPVIAQEIEEEMSKQVMDEARSAILFRVNDNITTVLGVVDGLKEGTLSHSDALSMLAPLRSANNDTVNDAGEKEAVPTPAPATVDLLGLDDSPRYADASSAPAPTTASSGTGVDALAMDFVADFGDAQHSGGPPGVVPPISVGDGGMATDKSSGTAAFGDKPVNIKLAPLPEGPQAVPRVMKLAPPPGGNAGGSLLPSPPKSNQGGLSGAPAAPAGDDLMNFLGGSVSVSAPAPVLQQKRLSIPTIDSDGRERRASTQELVSHYENLQAANNAPSPTAAAAMTRPRGISGGGQVDIMSQLHGQPLVGAPAAPPAVGMPGSTPMGSLNSPMMSPAATVPAVDPLADLMAASTMSAAPAPAPAPAPTSAPAGQVQPQTNPFDLF